MVDTTIPITNTSSSIRQPASLSRNSIQSQFEIILKTSFWVGPPFMDSLFTDGGETIQEGVRI